MPNNKKQTLEQKRERDRLQKRKKYEEIKNDPEKYAELKAKEKARYLKRKEQKKIKSAEDMISRQLRMQRKTWRINSKRHYERKKKEKAFQQLLLDNSPPSSDTEVPSVEQDPLARPVSSPIPSSSQNCVGSGNCQHCLKKDARLRKLRYRYKKHIGILKQEIEKVNKEKNSLRKMVYRLKQNRKKNDNTSTQEKIECLVENVNTERREEIKKKLIFAEVLSKSVGEGYKCLKKKEKKEFSKVVMYEKENFKKYKLLTHTKAFTVRNNKIKNEMANKENLIKQKILEFFEDDAVTRIAADKKEYITKNKIRKQKRYLTDTLSNLCKKFTHTSNIKVTYQTFCKYRPFWVLYPKESNRNTCACKVHINVDLLVKCLNTNKILKENNGTNVSETLCCNINNENCLNRTCEKCKLKKLNYAEFQNDKKIKYYQWGNYYEKYYVKDEEKTKLVTKKEIFYDFPRNIIIQLENTLDGYMNHCSNILTQYKNIKELKNNLTPQEVIIHIDFSENYSVKYNEEVQSFHFGGSRMQLSLHTCVIYLLDPEVGIQKQYSFCTVSECTQHDAAAIWAHLIPTIGYVMEISTQIDTIHFISDSPTSQYRNRYIFYMISQLYRDFPQLKSVSWNYLEAGHGKGAPDGIGAVLKRTADQVVRFGQDVDSLERFIAHLKPRVKIEIRIITRNDIAARSFPTFLKTAKGPMKVHQVLWSSGCSKMTLRKLSCFLCSNEASCSHGKHIGHYDIPFYEDVDTSQFHSFLDENTTPELIKEISDIDFSIPRSQPSISFEARTPNRPNSPKVKILSDIKLTDWESRAFIYKVNNASNKTVNKYQEDFEKFITSNSEINNDDNENIEENCEKNKKNIFWSDESDEENIF